MPKKEIALKVIPLGGLDGIGKNIVLPIISLMRGLIEYPHTVEDKTDKWFETTIKKGYFK